MKDWINEKTIEYYKAYGGLVCEESLINHCIFHFQFYLHYREIDSKEIDEDDMLYHLSEMVRTEALYENESGKKARLKSGKLSVKFNKWMKDYKPEEMLISGYDGIPIEKTESGKNRLSYAVFTRYDAKLLREFEDDLPPIDELVFHNPNRDREPFYYPKLLQLKPFTLLKELKFVNYEITEFPLISNPKSLEEFHCERGDIESLDPEIISKYTNLQTLNLKSTLQDCKDISSISVSRIP